MVITAADKQQSRASLAGLGSVHFIARRVVPWPPAVHCATRRESPSLDWTSIVYFAGETAGMIVISAGFEFTKLMTKGDTHWGRISIFGVRDFPHPTRLALGPTKFPIQWVPCSPGVNRLRRNVDPHPIQHRG
jgi:hypothetical protein